MKTRVAVRWSHLLATYWFIPGVMGVVALGLAIGAVRIDDAIEKEQLGWLWWLEISGPAGARDVLTTVATTAITVAGVVFSITMVVLNMASQQFGPRLLRTFMRHDGTQVTLGTFVGTSAYALVVLGQIGDGGAGGDDVSIPRVSLLLGVALGLASFGMLVFFIHHVSVFVRAPRIIDDVGRQLEAALRAAFVGAAPSPGRTPDEEEADVDLPPGAPRTTVRADASRYVQAIDRAALVGVARAHDRRVHLRVRAGDLALAGAPLVEVAPPLEPLPRDVEGAIRDAIVLGPERTSDQDPAFAISQLVDIALRALSPSLNDPHTAINCIDRIAGALVVLVGCRLASRYVRDDDGAVRLVTRPYTYGGILDTAFDELRVAAAPQPSVVHRLLATIERLAAHPLPAPVHDRLRAQVDAIGEACRGRFAAARDRDELDLRLRAAAAALARA